MSTYQFLGLIPYYLILSTAASAQIQPDQTLPNNSSISVKGKNITIDGGTIRGENLFHSFTEFSIPSEWSVLFNNGAGLRFILSRVTGTSISQINGTLQANGNASLFIVNPNGIVFGPNARLNIGGSFLATTADSLDLADGSQFSARKPTNQPLLSVAIPTGLTFSGRSGSIIVQGSGHNLSYLFPNSPVFSPIVETSGSTNGLRVQPGQTLALIGGPVTLNGGGLVAPFGQVQIGSVANGKVGLSQTSQGFLFNYDGVSRLLDTRLDGKSWIDTSGFGQINITSNNFFLNDYAVILHSNFSDVSSGSVNINATGSVILSASKSLFPPGETDFTGRGIFTQNFGSGNGANVIINANDMVVQNFTGINTATFSSGRGGDVVINVQNRLAISGTPPVDFLFLPSLINTNTYSSGQGGNISLSGQNLSVQNGGLILAISSGTGAGGNVQASFSERITATGFSQVGDTTADFIPSTVGVLSLSEGNAGDIVLTTKRLEVFNAARINATTTSKGTGGNILINATESVKVNGGIPDTSKRVSQILASADFPSGFLQNLLFLNEPPSGNSGTITINTKELMIAENGLINVRNEGTGFAGNLAINTDRLSLNRGELTAATASGNGGEIELNVKLLLLLQGGSSITASAKGAGLGGNIKIDTPLLVALDGSNISANAEKNTGGRVQITTTGLYLSRDSQITATSQLGPQFNGVIDINTPEINLATHPGLGFNLSVASQPLTCIGQRGTNLSVITASDLDKSDDQLEAIAKANNIPMFIDGQGRRQPLIEVQGWIPNGDGTATTIAVVENSSPAPSQFGTPCLAANE